MVYSIALEEKERLSILFPIYASHENLAAIEEDGVVPTDIVREIAEFVTTNGHKDEDHICHAEGLADDIEAYASELIERVKNMSARLKELDYHDGLTYRRETARAYLALAASCREILDFCHMSAHTTRENPIDLRRSFIQYKLEMKDRLPAVLETMDTIGTTFNVQQMSRYVRPLFF